MKIYSYDYVQTGSGGFRWVYAGVRFDSAEMCNTSCFLYWRRVKEALRVICG